MSRNLKHIPLLQTVLLLLLLLSTVCLLQFSTDTQTIRTPTLPDKPTETSQTHKHPTQSRDRFLSYQPPGNGWNNQRIALEHAVVFSRLLNRTLLVPPMAPHLPGKRYRGQGPNDPYTGYKVYNELSSDQLIPMDSIIDFTRLSQLIQVRASTGSHPEFLRSLSGLSWSRVCHSSGYGLWMDRSPRGEREEEMVSFQTFHVMSDWLSKCSEERKEFERGVKRPFLRFLLDELSETEEDIIYFEEGTLFGIDFRFQELQDAVTAQTWIAESIKYHPQIVHIADNVERYLLAENAKGYNAVHVRRNDRNSKYSKEFWLKRVKKQFKISPALPLYVSTDETNLTFFNTFREAGYSLVFRQNLQDLFNLGDTGASKRDIEGMSEQIVCARASSFVPSMRSTFTTLILRMRDELPKRDGVFLTGYYFYWAGHFTDEKATLNYNT